MSDKKPKIIEPSPLEKWWAEVQEWRAGRDKAKVAKRLREAEHFNDTRHLRGRRPSKVSKSVALACFEFVGALVSLIFGLFGALLRMGFWIAIVAGAVWVFSTVDVEDMNKKVDEIKEETELRGLVEDLKENFNDWHFEIQTKDGEVIEFGTKKDKPREAPSDE